MTSQWLKWGTEMDDSPDESEKRIVSFKNDRFDMTWHDPDSRHPPLGRDVAEYFCHALTSKGYASVVGVVEDGDGWEWDVSSSKATFALAAHWAPLGNPPQDNWVIQVRPRMGFIAFLLRRKGDLQEMGKLLRCLHELLLEPSFYDVHWLTMAEFKKIY